MCIIGMREAGAAAAALPAPAGAISIGAMPLICCIFGPDPIRTSSRLQRSKRNCATK
uniref:Uncharacterized protein n=1 Tax=Zea mays TaxID=4577 RepID=C4J578_MAIZE|nr:unknown [Zea mays]ACR37394.1 unknown [Zea mays]